MDKMQLRTALVRILAQVPKDKADRISESIKVVENYVIEIDNMLAAERSVQRRLAKLVAAGIKYWNKRARDDKGQPIPLFDEVKQLMEQIALTLPDDDDQAEAVELLIGNMGISFSSTMGEYEDDDEKKRVWLDLKQREPNGFAALEEFLTTGY